jgi:membrane protein implicated in regulation of membrane protease activity
MNADQIIVRDSIIFAVALLFVAAGLADALRLFTGLSWWGAAPVGAGLWVAAAVALYRRVRRRTDAAEEPAA